MGLFCVISDMGVRGMPVMVRYRRGSGRPWKIVERSTGKVMGSSTTKSRALSSMRVRNVAHRVGRKRAR